MMKLPQIVLFIVVCALAFLLLKTRWELDQANSDRITLKTDVDAKTKERDDARAEAESMLRFCHDQGFDVHKLVMPDGSFRAFRKNPDGTPNEEDVIEAIKADIERRQKLEAEGK